MYNLTSGCVLIRYLITFNNTLKMAIFCLIYIVYKVDDSFLVNLLHWNLTQEHSDVIIVNACDVECLMFYTHPKFLSECIFKQSGNSLDPDQI